MGRQLMKSRNVILALLGVAVLVGASHYAGPGEQMVRAYAGNVAVSFALYFATLSATQRWHRSRLGAALITLVAVTLFEVSDGFGVMDNVFDQWDFVANAAGLALALIADVGTVTLIEGPRAPGTP